MHGENRKTNMNRLYFFILIFIIMIGLGANWVIKTANKSHDIPIIKQIPDFALLNQDGKAFTQDDFKDKITVLDFFFTNCAGPCPIMTYNMKSLYNDFSKADDVQFVSITVDPQNDDKKILKEYAEINGVKDQRWQFLTADLNTIKSLKSNGFMLFADQLPQGHAIKFVLIDEQGNIRKYFDGTDDASMLILKKDISELVRNLRSI